MALLTFTGNLTQNAELRTHEGRNYVLLRVAENIRKRNEKGEIERDINGHPINMATYFHSVFVNKGDIAFQVQNLKSGDPIKVSGIAKLKIIKDEEGYDQYVVERIVARYVDTDPFNRSEADNDDSQIAVEEEKEIIPFNA